MRDLVLLAVAARDLGARLQVQMGKDMRVALQLFRTVPMDLVAVAAVLVALEGQGSPTLMSAALAVTVYKAISPDGWYTTEEEEEEESAGALARQGEKVVLEVVGTVPTTRMRMHEPLVSTAWVAVVVVAHM